MKRLAPVLLAALALAAVPAASSQLAATPRNLPSSTVPNAAGSIRVPTPLSRAPARPETRTYEQLVTLWKQAGEGYGVPWEVLGAINKIETGYGQNMGPSSAGAVGWMQFMPSTWMRWGMDADRDGLANPWDPEDAVFAAARYLAAAGAHESIERAIFAYNHAQWYVDDVLALAATLGDAPFTAGPSTLTTAPGPDLGAKLEKARARVQRLSDALDLALGRIGERDWQRLRLERRLGDPSLSDAEFAKLDARLAGLDDVERASQAKIDKLQARFAKAVEALKAIKGAQEAAALGAGLAGGGYVFPIAGEASFSDSFGVPRTTTWHHGIDVFAELGTPLVAVADGTLSDVGWNDVGGKRLWLRDAAGNQFYYAHLAGFSPLAREGAVVRAGDVVGFVGDTGDAQGTPPHLHFEIHPPELSDQGYDGVVNPYPYLVAWRAGLAAGGQQSFDGWVFPVGGGAANVSTAHTHHDYPAADIAAPLGSPLYALHESVVTAALPHGLGEVRDRAHPPDDDRRGVPLLPPLLARAGPRHRPEPRRGRAGRARRVDRELHGPAPPSPVLPVGPLPAGRAVVPGLRRHRVPLAGRRHARSLGSHGHERPQAGRGDLRPARLQGRAQARAHLHDDRLTGAIPLSYREGA